MKLNEGSRIDEESSNGSFDSSEEFIQGGSGEGFKEFKPSAVLTDEDKKTMDKVRDAGYKVPKYDIIKEYQNLQKHFLDDEAQRFDENRKIAKYAKMSMTGSSKTPAQAAAVFQCRYRFKIMREEKRRKELLQGCNIGFFVRKYFCHFRSKKIDPEDSRHFYVKYLIKKSLHEDSIVIQSKDFVFGKEKSLVIKADTLPEEEPDIVDCCKAW